MSFAEGTSVTPERSRAELDRLLAKAGSSRRMMGVGDDVGAYCIFHLAGREIRLRVPLPSLESLEPAAGKEPPGWRRKTAEQRRAWVVRQREQIEKARWRALVLICKAKLEIIELGLSTVEREFLADIFLADGRTVHEVVSAPLAEVYLTGVASTPLLLGPAPAKGAVP